MAVMKLLSGNSNRPLAEAVAAHLGVPLCRAVVRRFADQEIWVEVLENVRGEDVFVIQSTSAPANDHLMELLIIIDALRRASARRITAVIPYFGYARQDRKQGPRTPISAKLVANLITQAGAHRVLTVDLHAGQVQGFFDIPTDNLFAAPVMVADKKIACPAQLAVGPDGQGNSLDHIKEIMGTSMEALIHHFKLVTEGFRVPAGQAFTQVEHPRGVLGVHLVSDGGTRPYRAHFRDPSFNNLQAVSVMCEGGNLADVVAAVASIDPVLGGVDR